MENSVKTEFSLFFILSYSSKLICCSYVNNGMNIKSYLPYTTVKGKKKDMYDYVEAQNNLGVNLSSIL